MQYVEEYVGSFLWLPGALPEEQGRHRRLVDRLRLLMKGNEVTYVSLLRAYWYAQATTLILRYEFTTRPTALKKSSFTLQVNSSATFRKALRA